MYKRQVNDTVKSTVGTPMILWSIDTLDWKTQDVESTVEEVMNNVKDGSIILMHDIFSTSVDAVSYTHLDVYKRQAIQYFCC